MDMRKMMMTNWCWSPDFKPEMELKSTLVCFRKAVNLDKAPDKCVVKISGETRYKLYVNGFFVNEGPSKGDLETWYADTVDITEYLKAGENVIAAEVLRIPNGPDNANTSLYRTPWPGFYIADEALEGVPEGFSFAAKEEYKCRIVEGTGFRAEKHSPAPIKLLEDACGDAAFAGWKRPGYDDSEWSVATCYTILNINQAMSPFNLADRTIPLMQHTAKRFAEVVCFRDSEGKLIADNKAGWEKLILGGSELVIPADSRVIVEISAGELECGFINYAFKGGKGATIAVLPSECYAYPQPMQMTPRGPVQPAPKKGDRTDYVNGVLTGGMDDHYTVGGFGTDEIPEEYTPFWFRTFRYLQLDIVTADEPLVITKLDYIETGYPLEVKTELTCSDPTFEKIWDISLRTLKRCMMETYFDCPYYEQLQYSQDSRSEILFTYAVSGDDRLARRCIDDFRRSQRTDGLINASAPTTRANVIPGFSVYYIMMIHDHMMYFGDKELVAEYLPSVERVLNYFDKHIAENGMVSRVGGMIMRDKYWSFIDWAADWQGGTPPAYMKGTGAITAESLLYLMGLDAAADLCGFVGRNEIAASYRAQAEVLRLAIRKNAIGSLNGIPALQDGPGVDDYSVHCQVLGVITGVFDEMDAGAGKRALQATVGNPEIPQASVSFTFYLLRALEKADWYEKADDVWDTWRKMVEDNMTTCVENDTDARSDCHAWASALLYELPAVYAGVRPVKPGCTEMNVKPLMGHLSWIKGRVYTPQGFVEVSHRDAP